MWKTTYTLALIALGGTVLGGCTGESKNDFTVCDGIYALCTTAPCQPIAGQEDAVSCDCTVQNGYSAGLEACKDEIVTAEGKQIVSRYYPIKSYAICSNDRPWANCLDSPCIVDKSDPGKAACTCPVVKKQGPYVIVTETYDASTCTTGLWSSATVSDANTITDFLKTNDNLKPSDIKVLNPE
jgi:hypothetical protein